ncbi:MAG: hypothetical protein AVDCRST_MAG04-1034, partial [uncultured Acetobacteraceae bacterium]
GRGGGEEHGGAGAAGGGRGHRGLRQGLAGALRRLRSRGGLRRGPALLAPGHRHLRHLPGVGARPPGLGRNPVGQRLAAHGGIRLPAGQDGGAGLAERGDGGGDRTLDERRVPSGRRTFRPAGALHFGAAKAGGRAMAGCAFAHVARPGRAAGEFRDACGEGEV